MLLFRGDNGLVVIQVCVRAPSGRILVSALGACVAREIGGKSGIGRTETAHGRYEAAEVLVLNEKHELFEVR